MGKPCLSVRFKTHKIQADCVTHSAFQCHVVRVTGHFMQLERLNTLTPELNPSAQRCLTRFFTGDFASWTVHFVNICVKSQQIHQLFIQLIDYVWYLLHVSALYSHPQRAFLVPSERCSIEDIWSHIATHHVTRHNPPIHNLLLTAPQSSTFQKVLGTLPEDGNVMSKHVEATIHN
jgi:hypothetical protein